MPVEKNVCDSVTETLLNVKEMTKYGVQARQDLSDVVIHSKLHPQLIGRRTSCPQHVTLFLKRENKCVVNV